MGRAAFRDAATTGTSATAPTRGTTTNQNASALEVARRLRVSALRLAALSKLRCGSGPGPAASYRGSGTCATGAPCNRPAAPAAALYGLIAVALGSV